MIIFLTGGTFDKQYDPIESSLTLTGQDHVSEMLKIARCTLDIYVQRILCKDSRDMIEKDILNILEHCQDCQDDQIIIVHGTDRIIQTAIRLKELKLIKTIVLTGALVPYRVGNSDAMFNLGTTIGFVQAMPTGVYVVMNGQCFDPERVVKNYHTGHFDRL
jgi:L-asparaginase